MYYILQSETSSIITSPISHFFGRRGWGSYSWSLHPCKNTNTRERSGFFIHGGSESTSAGCIDLREHDITFNTFLHHSVKKKLYIYIRYPEENVSVSEKNMILPAFNPYKASSIYKTLQEIQYHRKRQSKTVGKAPRSGKIFP